MASFSVSLNIAGMSDLGNALNDRSVAVEEAKNAAVDQIVQLLAETAAAYAEGGHPNNPEVDTGTLQSSLTWQHVADGVATAYTELDYAYWVEFGHAPSGWYANMSDATDVPAYPFFRPAITQVENSGEAMEIISNLLQDAMATANGGGGDAEGGEEESAVPSDIGVEADL